MQRRPEGGCGREAEERRGRGEGHARPRAEGRRVGAEDAALEAGGQRHGERLGLRGRRAAVEAGEEGPA